MRIIDSQLHYGVIGKFSMTESKLLNIVDDNKLAYGIVSNIEGIEFGHEYELLSYNREMSQVGINERLLKIIKKHPDKLLGKFWIKPATEGFSRRVKNFMLDNRNYFRAFKVHPFHSQTKITDSYCMPYLEFAKDHNIPIAVHTAYDEFSSPKTVYEAALQYPEVDFIMVHMGLGTDHEDAIKYIQELPNLYGDSTWVEPEKVLKAIKVCGSHKILFGSDAPIDEDTYDFYNKLFKLLEENLDKNESDNFFYLNSLRLFGDIIKD